MRSFTVIILHGCMPMAPAKEMAQNPIDKLVDKLINKFIDHVINMPAHHADLDKTTLALQSALTSGVAPMMAPRVSPMASSRTVTLFGPSRPASNQPVVSMNAMRGNAMMPAPTTPITSGGGMAQVYAMQDALKAYGVPPSPMGKLALTSLVATRDPSMKAQVREVFNSLEPSLQARVKKLNNDVIVKAETLAGESSLTLETMAGKTEPMGIWDPLGLATDIPAGRLYWYREAELKNGRTAMMAVVGIVVSENFRPFWDDSTEWVSAVQSHWTSEAVDQTFWPALFILGGIFELATYPDRSKPPGDLGFDPLGLKPKGDSLLEIQNKELNNGRLAMIASIGIIGKELMTGDKVF